MFWSTKVNTSISQYEKRGQKKDSSTQNEKLKYELNMHLQNVLNPDICSRTFDLCISSLT